MGRVIEYTYQVQHWPISNCLFVQGDPEMLRLVRGLIGAANADRGLYVGAVEHIASTTGATDAAEPRRVLLALTTQEYVRLRRWLRHRLPQPVELVVRDMTEEQRDG